MVPRVLLVDDDEHPRKSLAIGFRLGGLDVREVPDGLQALELLSHWHFDIAVVDLMMPGLNGLQLIRKIAQTHPRMPVVLMSGYHLSRKQLEQIGLNTVAFVPKPYDLDQLVQFVWDKTGQVPPAQPQLRTA